MRRYHVAPWGCKFPKEGWNICRPGKKPKSDNEYFEILSLMVFQAGFNWGLVREKWSDLKKIFRGFKIEDVARLTEKQQETILEDPKMIRNKRKIKAVVANAETFREIIREFGSVEGYLRSLRTLGKEKRVREIKNRFSGIGDYHAEFFLHSVGEI